MGGATVSRQQMKDRGYMESLEVAERIAGFERGQGYVKVPGKKGRWRRQVHDDVSRWRRRLRLAMQRNEISHSRPDGNPDGPALFWWSDVTKWLSRRWPRQHVRWL